MKVNKMKIYNLSHYDLDGFGCQLCVYEKFKNHNINFKNCGYKNIIYELNKISFNEYDLIIITDLNFDLNAQKHLYEKLKNFKGKFIYIDHHLYENKEYLDKIKNELNHKIIIDTSKSATLKTYEILKLDNNNLKNLCEIIDIYDVWREENPKFKLANLVNDYFWSISEDFREKMISQNYKFSQEDKEKIKYFKEYSKKYIENNLKNGIIIESPNLIISFDFKYTNHFKEYFNNPNILICNLKNNKFSLRLKEEDSNKRDIIIDWIKKNFYPETIGGHQLAIGFEFIKLEKNSLKIMLEGLVNILNDKPNDF